jgi:MFS family permease
LAASTAAISRSIHEGSLSGCLPVSAKTFIAELVGDADLSNAVALNSTSFNAGQMVGPAVAGVVIASIGTSWAFLINGVSFWRGADLPLVAPRVGASFERKGSPQQRKLH